TPRRQVTFADMAESDGNNNAVGISTGAEIGGTWVANSGVREAVVTDDECVSPVSICGPSAQLAVSSLLIPRATSLTTAVGISTGAEIGGTWVANSGVREAVVTNTLGNTISGDSVR
ncbi:hypothetical protein EUX98_g9564, partial [Antrodiella citrinella]